LPALSAYWEYQQFKEKPDITYPGSHKVWHSFRIVDQMYSVWDHIRQDPESGKKALRKGLLSGRWEYKYIPQQRVKKKGKSSRSGRSGEDLP
jgi:hypothetical protein